MVPQQNIKFRKTNMSSKALDKQITALFDTLMNRKASVEADEAEIKRSWKTNCSFVRDGIAQPLNIQVAQEPMLLKLYADILATRDYEAKAAAELGIDISSKISGFELEDWVADFKKRIASIHIKSKKTKLLELETRLEAIISPEQRREMELASILNELE